MISVVTPWLDHSELCRAYERSVAGAQAIVVDNGSQPEHAAAIKEMVNRLNRDLSLFADDSADFGEVDGAELLPIEINPSMSIYIRNEENRLFSAANNQGLAVATGEIVVFMNNDVDCRPGWLDQVAADVRPGALYGPSLLIKHGWQYLEGWCIAARREVWDALGGWEEHYYQGLYWEDNDLCARATQAGFDLVQTRWPVWHFNNYTSRHIPGARENGPENEKRFLERVRSWRD